MSLFGKRKGPSLSRDTIKSPLPVQHLDITKRYDIYCWTNREERVYEDVKLLSVKTLDDISQFRTRLGEYLEIEARDGTKGLIPKMRIQDLYEHGVRPVYKVVQSWTDRSSSHGEA